MFNSDELFTGILIFGAIIGAAVFALFFWLIPLVWEWVKPWLHTVTS